MNGNLKKNVIAYSLGWSVATMPVILTNLATSKMKHRGVASLILLTVAIGGTIIFGRTIKDSLVIKTD